MNEMTGADYMKINEIRRVIDVVFDLGLSLLNSRSDVLTHVLDKCILVRTCSSIQSINGKSILNFRLSLFRSFVNFLCFLRC